jgi:environmental stress-induced protein Ves
MLPTRVIRFADQPVTLWKNGLGVTRELVSVGVRADGSFGWRLSMAEIAVDAPFSSFPGIERELAVVAGGPLELVVAGTPQRLEIGGAVAIFAGDTAVSARPLGATVTDLNLMFDPAAWMGSLKAMSAAAVAISAEIAAIVSLDDGLTVRLTDGADSTQEFALDALDCLLARGPVTLSVESAADVPVRRAIAMLVTLQPI